MKGEKYFIGVHFDKTMKDKNLRLDIKILCKDVHN